MFLFLGEVYEISYRDEMAFHKKVSVKNSAWFLLEKGVTNMERVEARIKPYITGLEL